MAATAAHLIDDVLPAAVPLRQWVLTVPFAWRKRLGYDGALLSALTRLFVKTVLGFYRERGGGAPGQSGAVVAVQRTSSDLKLNPHVHAVFFDGVFRDGDELTFHARGHLSTRDVAAVLEQTRDRMAKYLRRRGLLDEQDAEEGDTSEHAGLTRLAASAVSGMTPPAGPEWRRGALPLTHRPMVFERPLCVALDGFPPSGITKRVTLHAATRAGGLDDAGREALLKYILRPAVAQESPVGDHEARRVTRGPDGLVSPVGDHEARRIALKKAFSDGTVAVDLDPLSLLSRLCAAVPPPRFHTVRYAGVLASASPPSGITKRVKLRSRLVRSRLARSRLAPKGAAEPTVAVRRRPRRRAPTKPISTMGRATEENVRSRRPGLPAMPGAHATARYGHRRKERHALSPRSRRADGSARDSAGARTSVLEESYPPKSSHRRRGCRVSAAESQTPKGRDPFGCQKEPKKSPKRAFGQE
jgi:hypothetical protein